MNELMKKSKLIDNFGFRDNNWLNINNDFHHMCSLKRDHSELKRASKIEIAMDCRRGLKFLTVDKGEEILWTFTIGLRIQIWNEADSFRMSEVQSLWRDKQQQSLAI